MAFKPTIYQQAVFDWIQKGSGNLIIQAVAGSGKTTTIMQGLEKIPRGQKVLMLAFNRSIANELNERIRVLKRKKGSGMASVEAFTQNGIGFRVLRKWAESKGLNIFQELNAKKYDEIVKDDGMDRVFGIYSGKDKFDISKVVEISLKSVYTKSKIKDSSELKTKKITITLINEESSKTKEIPVYEKNKRYYFHYFLTFFNYMLIERKFITFKDLINKPTEFQKYLKNIVSTDSKYKIYSRILTKDQIDYVKDHLYMISQLDLTKKEDIKEQRDAMKELVKDLKIKESSLYALPESKVVYNSSVFILDSDGYFIPKDLNSLNMSIGLTLSESYHGYKAATLAKDLKMQEIYQFALGEKAVRTKLESSLAKCIDLAKSNGFGVNQILSDAKLKKDTYWLRMIYYYQIVRSDDSNDLMLAFKTKMFIDNFKDTFFESIENRNIITFTDMLYQPAKFEKDLKFPQYDWVIIDECQDTNLVTQILLQNLLKPKTGRLIAIGDVSQAIYGFRGASATAMQSLQKRFNCQELPLSECFRCSKQIIRLAQKHMPSILARPEAPQGLVENVGYINRIGKQRDVPLYYFGSKGITSAIISRSNYPLIEIAKLLAIAKIPFYFMGNAAKTSNYFINQLKMLYNDYQNRINLARIRLDSKRWQTIELSEFVGLIEQMESKESKFDVDAELEDLNPKDLYLSFVEKVKTKAPLVIKDKDDNIIATDHYFSQLESTIKESFSDSPMEDAIGLTTVHKSKGREFFRVFLLNYGKTFYQKEEKIREWQKEQEKNMAYVAITRAERELLFINMDDRIGIQYVQNKAVPYMKSFDAEIFRMYRPSATDPFVLEEGMELGDDEAKLFGIFPQEAQTEEIE